MNNHEDTKNTTTEQAWRINESQLPTLGGLRVFVVNLNEQ